MWIASKYGFFSVAAAHANPEDRSVYPPEAHPSLMMIRARCKAHLQKLVSNTSGLQGCEIIENQGTDYPFRIFASRGLVLEVMYSLVKDCTYTNFKDAVGAQRARDNDFLHFLHRVWEIGLSLTPWGDRGRSLYQSQAAGILEEHEPETEGPF